MKRSLVPLLLGLGVALPAGASGIHPSCVLIDGVYRCQESEILLNEVAKTSSWLPSSPPGHGQLPSFPELAGHGVVISFPGVDIPHSMTGEVVTGIGGGGAEQP